MPGETVVSVGCLGGIVLTVTATFLPGFVVFTCEELVQQRIGA